jgi:hypothetical protein
MSKSGGGSTTRVELDPEFKTAALDVYGRAQQIADQPYTPYQGARIAAPTQATLTGLQRLAQVEPTSATTLGLQQLAQAGQVGPGTATVDYATSLAMQPSGIAQNIGQFVNPFQTQVINTALQNIETQRQQQQLGNLAAATRARAFGGSRQGIVEGLTNQAALMAAGQTAGQLASQGFTQAAQLAAQDVAARQAQAAQLAGLGAQQQAIRSQQAQQLLSAGGAEDALRQAQAQQLMQVGGIEQGLQQQQLDLAYQDFLRQQQYPLQQLGILQAGLGQFPAQNEQVTTQRMSPGQQIGLGVSTLASLAYLFAPSDKRMKENIDRMDSPLSQIGKLSGYDYNYKGDDQRTGGVMAQDVRRVMPDAVAQGDNGMMAVNYPKVTGLLVEAVKELDRRTRG